MRRTYLVAGESFPTASALTARIRGIAERGHRRLDGADLAFMRALLDLHHDRTAKVGPGVASISVVPNSRNPKTWSLQITRVDGSTDDFSYRSCLRERDPVADALAAFRDEVADQVSAHALAHGGGSGTGLVVHHDPPFRDIVDRFCGFDGLSLADISTVEPEEKVLGCGEARFADRDLASRWQSFHREHARLRVITEAEHHRIHARG